MALFETRNPSQKEEIRVQMTAKKSGAPASANIPHALQYRIRLIILLQSLLRDRGETKAPPGRSVRRWYDSLQATTFATSPVEANLSLRAFTPRTSLYASRLHDTTTKQDVLDYIFARQQAGVFKDTPRLGVYVVPLESCHCSGFNLFVGVFTSPVFWPQGVVFRCFRGKLPLTSPPPYILHYAGEKFEDVRYELKDWPIQSVKDSLPYGQLPLYEENGRSLNQSLAIARYVAQKAHLLPSDPWEQAKLDAIVYNIYDFWMSKYCQLLVRKTQWYQSLAIARYVAHKAHLFSSGPWEQAKLDAIVYNIYDFWMKFVVYLKEQDPVKKEEVKKQILEEFVDFYFSRFEKELKNNGGYFGGKLSWADFILIGIVETVNLIFKTEIEKKYPTVQALINKIRVLPGVKEYIAGI
ncbi:glutathione S-transferase-like [Phthorimaea operculella]|nr:glutathione S-transferase-like [Phthorimaea operculella]